MANESTTGDVLRALQIRSGRSYRQIAKLAGYAHASGIQRYFSPEYAEPLPLQVASKLLAAFEGTGVTADEVWALTGLPERPNAVPVAAVAVPYQSEMPQDVPIYGTALGGLYNGPDLGIEQTQLDQGDVVQYIRRPPSLSGRKDVYGVYVQGGSMSPRFQDGEIALAETRRPPMIGDDVLVYLRGDDGDDGERVYCCLIKRLVRRTAAFVELEQFNPAVVFRVPTEQVASMHRLLTYGELLS